MAATSENLLTFTEFELLPEPSTGIRQELRHGELFLVHPNKNSHFVVQQQLRDLLDHATGDTGRAFTGAGFRPRSEHEFWIADVAFFSAGNWQRFRSQDYYDGAPDLVIEVLSCNTMASDVLDKENICLENGCREFWLADAGRRQVRVTAPDGHGIIYKSGQRIPLLFGGEIAVDDIFA